MRIPLRKFNRGLYVSEPAEGIPEGALVRARGIDRDTPWKSRQGSTALVQQIAPHSITYFNDHYFYGESTYFKATTQSVSVSTGLSGNRLSFARMSPTAGYNDCLFVTDSTTIFKTEYHNVGFSGATDSYAWTESATGTDNYYLTDSSGDDLDLQKPITVFENSVVLTTGTLGSLSSGEWAWGDHADDSLGFNTLYVRLKDSTTPDPDDQAVDYLRAHIAKATNWGIAPPAFSPTITTGGAGNLTGAYSYLCTFKNSHTGGRSNPSPGPSTEGTELEDEPEKEEKPRYSLLLACEGTHGSTTLTDTGGKSHLVITTGNAALSTADAILDTGYGNSVLIFDGVGDCAYVSANNDWSFDDKPFTVDMRINLASTADFTFISCASTAASDREYWRLAYDAASTAIIFETAFKATKRYYFNKSYWTWDPSTGTWYHLALIRGWGEDDRNFCVTVDGTPLTFAGGARLWGHKVGYPGGPLQIGRFFQGSSATEYFDGRMNEIRVFKGTAAWSTDFTPSTASYGASTTSVTAEKLLLSNIPKPADDQVDTIEIWRTQAGGVAYFHLADISADMDTFEDNIPDIDLSLTELRYDYNIPYAWFDDCIGPHNGSMFWITRTKEGERGRLYYSAIGRAESMEGFIEVSSDDDPLQKLVFYQGQLGVLSQSRVFQIIGDNPYFAKEISGAPGTTRPHSVAVTPYGIAYEAHDGFRLLTGLTTTRIDQPLARVISGEAVENLTAWGGGSSATIATYARGEYIISDSSQTLAYDFENRRWRDLGLACTALFYNAETDQLVATVGTNLLEVEKYGEDDDSGTGIPYAVQTASLLLSDDKKGLVQHVHVDCNTNGETITVDLAYDDSSTKTLGTIETSSRTITTLPVNIQTRNAGVRLTGTLSSGTVYLYGIDLDVYIPGEEKT